MKNRSLMGILRQIGSFLLSGELFLFLVPVSGQFKELIPLNKYIDMTIVFMLLSLLCAAYRIFRPGFLRGLREINWRRVPALAIPYVLVVVAMIWSTNWSLSSDYAKEKIRDFGVIIGWCIAGAVILLNNRKSVERFLACNISYGVFMTFGMYYAIIANGLFKYKFQVEVFNTNYLQVSRYITGGLILLLCYTLLRAKKWQLWFLVPLCGLMFGAIMTCGARSNVVVAFAALALFGLFMFRVKGGLHLVNYWPRYVSVLMACMVLFLSIGYTGRLRYILGRFDNFSDEVSEASAQFVSDTETLANVEAILTPPKELTEDDEERGTVLVMTPEEHQRLRIQIPFTDQSTFRDELVKYRKLLINRFYMYTVAWRMFEQRPLTGWGVGSFPIYMTNMDKRLFPHCMPLEIMAEEGLFGVIPFMALLIGAFVKAAWALWKNRKTRLNYYYLCVFSLLCFWLTMVISSDTSQGVRIMYMFITIAYMDPASFRGAVLQEPDPEDFVEYNVNSTTMTLEA